MMYKKAWDESIFINGNNDIKDATIIGYFLTF
jgi:hypothetical protein